MNTSIILLYSNDVLCYNSFRYDYAPPYRRNQQNKAHALIQIPNLKTNYPFRSTMEGNQILSLLLIYQIFILETSKTQKLDLGIPY